MNIAGRFLPFVSSFGGVLADYLTTTIGLGLGFYETHPQYHPISALIIFWGAIAALTLLLPKGKIWSFGINAIGLASYLGAVNNTLVILGLFPGLRI